MVSNKERSCVLLLILVIVIVVNEERKVFINDFDGIV